MPFAEAFATIRIMVAGSLHHFYILPA